MTFTQIQRSVALLLGNDSAVALSKTQKKDKPVSKSSESPNIMQVAGAPNSYNDIVGSKVDWTKDEGQSDSSCSQTFKDFVQCSAIM